MAILSILIVLVAAIFKLSAIYFVFQDEFVKTIL